MIAGRLSQSRSLGFLVWCGRTRHERLSLARAPRSYDRASRSLSRSKARLVSKSRLRVRLRCVKTGRSANTRGVFHLPRNSGSLYGGQIYIINSFDKTKFLYTTCPPTQHHSFFRNYPLLPRYGKWTSCTKYMTYSLFTCLSGVNK